MNILLAVDDSPDSQAAALFLQRIQFPAKSTLYLLHVNPLDEWPRPRISGRTKHTGKQISQIRAAADTNMRNILKHMEDSFRSSNLGTQSVVTNGSPGAEILKAITRHHIDLVVLGTRGLSKISGVLLGSVSEWVLNEAPCSVLIVRGKTRQKKSAKGMNILIGIDGSPDARNGIKFFNKLAFPRLTTLTILHVVKKKIHQTAQLLTANHAQHAEFKKLAEDLLKARGREGTKLLEDAKSALNRQELKIDENLAFGHEAEELLKAIKRIHADLVIVGSKGLTGLRRFLLGSVAHKLAHHAQCSVLVAKQTTSNGKTQRKRQT